MRRSKGQLAAQKVLADNGFDEITDIQIDLFAAGLGATYIEEDLSNCDGKIVFGKEKAVIKIDSKIQFPERKRFVAAHEIGHLVMHRNLPVPPDSFLNLNLIEGVEFVLKSGIQEIEANEFASELLMPEKLFLEAAWRRKFGPMLVKNLAERFNVSLTAVIFRYFYFDLHPLCLFYIENGVQKYWKKSDALKVWIPDTNGLEPPSNSVASEYIRTNYESIYKLEEKAQPIKKSTWFDIDMFPQEDNDFYEYCIPTKKNKSILSIVWQD